MILAALERGTGRAVAFGVPRNLVNVPLGGARREELPHYDDLLNSLYRFATEQRPELFPGGEIRARRRSSRRSPTCSGCASTTTPWSTSTASATWWTRSAASRFACASASSTRSPGRHGARRSPASTCTRADVPFQRPHRARVRALAQGVGRLHADAPPAVLPDGHGDSSTWSACCATSGRCLHRGIERANRYPA